MIIFLHAFLLIIKQRAAKIDVLIPRHLLSKNQKFSSAILTADINRKIHFLKTHAKKYKIYDLTKRFR